MAQRFAKSLQQAGSTVETGWPRTPHVGREKVEYRSEFSKFTRGAIEFFLRATQNE